ncbi:MAG: BamA/TamA family outer membrane protein [Bacteroidota bacterium]
MSIRKYYIIIILFTLLASCNNLKKIPAGDALYTGSTIRIDSTSLNKKQRKSLASDLHSLVRPKPNKKILGIRFKLSAYNLAGNPKKESSLAGWLKNKVGEPPVLLSDVSLDRNIKLLQNTLENTGFFQATVQGDTIVKNKKATAIYTVQTGPRYFINEVRFTIDSSELQKKINEDSTQTFLKPGQPFDLAVVKDERERIDANLKEKGFYFFDPDFMIVQVDSTIGNNKVNLYVKVKPSAPEVARQVYTINEVYIFPGYRLNSLASDTAKKEAVYYKGYYVLDRQKQYKPSLFEHTMQFSPGDIYNRTDHNTTLSRLVNLGLFKFVKNRLEVVPGIDSAKLNAYYYLTPFPRQALRTEINASTKTNNLTGSSITTGWRKRNAFRGGELLGIDATGGFEVQYSGQLKGYNTYHYGLETNLSFPRFLIPLIKVSNKGGFIPKTNMLLAYDVLIKQKLYRMNSFRASFGYVWKNNFLTEQQFNPIAINYVQPAYISQQYSDSILKNASLAKAVEKQFILGSVYNYNYNQVQDNIFKTGIYFNGNVDISGNVAGLLTGANVNKGKPKFILGAQFSQYLRMETDLRYYLKLSATKVLANRIIIGVALPYGNSTALPFVKQFFAGGNNSVRAFRSRSVGPGSYKQPPTTTFLADQSGDLKLELNSELRAKLFSIVHGALFIDAGNIWLYNTDTSKPGARFSNKFLKELAVGTGVGLRFDISFLVLRLDLAFPLRKPYLPDGQRWVINKIDFSSASWRKENLVLNLGIGYPF